MDPAGGILARGRLPGHALRCNAQAYLAVDCYVDRCATNLGATVHQENGPNYDSVRGRGHGVCECGTLSGHLLTGAERRRWHRSHKARVILGRAEPAGQPAPVAPERIS